jgi:hypothetical protein
MYALWDRPLTYFCEILLSLRSSIGIGHWPVICYNYMNLLNLIIVWQFITRITISPSINFRWQLCPRAAVLLDLMMLIWEFSLAVMVSCIAQGSYPAGWQAASHGGALSNPSFSQPPQRRRELNCFFFECQLVHLCSSLATGRQLLRLKKKTGAPHTTRVA